MLSNGLNLAVTEPGIVAPVSVKQFVTFNSGSEEDGIGLIVEYSVSEFGRAQSAATRNNLLKRIEWIEGTRWNTSLGRGRRTGR